MKQAIATALLLTLCISAFGAPRQRRRNATIDVVPIKPVVISTRPIEAGHTSQRVWSEVKDIPPNSFVTMTDVEITKTLSALISGKAKVDVSSIMRQLLQTRAKVEVERIIAAIVPERFIRELPRLVELLDQAENGEAERVMGGLYMAHVLVARKPEGAAPGESVNPVSVIVDAIQPGKNAEKAILFVSSITSALLAEDVPLPQIVAVLRALGIDSTELIVGGMAVAASSEKANLTLSAIVGAALSDTAHQEVKAILQGVFMDKSEVVIKAFLQAILANGTSTSVQAVLQALVVDKPIISVEALLNAAQTTQTTLSVKEILAAALEDTSTVVIQSLLRAELANGTTASVREILRALQVNHDPIVVLSILNGTLSNRISVTARPDKKFRSTKKANVDIYDSIMTGKIRWLLLQIETAHKECDLELEAQLRKQAIDLFNEWLNEDAPNELPVDEPL